MGLERARRVLALGLVLTGLAAVPDPVLARVGEARRLSFDVFLDDRPIGSQQFALEPTPDGLRVETRATFSLALLRIPVFAYDHENVEQWRGNCLESIRSRTNSNGTRYQVSGSARADGFQLLSNTGEQRLDACVASFSYWDKQRLLQRARLLNAQTGEYVPVSVRSVGTGRLALAGRSLAVERYAIEGQGLSITVEYAQGSDEWVALESRVAGGRTLTYRRSADEAAALLAGSAAAGAETAR